VSLPLVFAALAHQRRAAQAVAAKAPAQAALAALAASPAAQFLNAPPAARAIQQGRQPGPARTVSQAAGVAHPTPAEVATLASKAHTAAAQASASSALAKSAAWLKAHPKPAANAQPADVAAWLNGCGMSPRAAYPEWGWHVIQKGPPLTPPASFGNIAALIAQAYEPGEAIAAVQLGSNDAVTWYQHPSGAWSYHHVWGEDWTQVLSDVASAVGQAVADAAKVVGQALKAVQTVASFIPGVGTVVNEIVAAAETAIDALSGDNALQLALESAYRAALALVPGAEALQPLLDPVVDTLKTIAGGKKAISKAVLSGLLSNVPDQPSVGSLSPRSVATSLATWLASKVGLA